MRKLNLKNKVLFTIVVAMVGVAVISCKDDNDLDDKTQGLIDGRKLQVGII